MLTYTMLEAFQNPDARGGEVQKVDVDDLARFVGDKAPELTKALYGNLGNNAQAARRRLLEDLQLLLLRPAATRSPSVTISIPAIGLFAPSLSRN